MEFVSVILNVFIVPFCGAFAFLKKSKRTASRFDFAGIYSFFCVLNFIFSRAAVSLVRLFFSDIDNHPLFVTTVVFLCAMILAVLAVIFTDFIHIELLIGKKDETKK